MTKITTYSVIIPVYQVERYLEQCLNSVLTQISSQVQVVLVDDGSKDRSGVLCDQYAKRFSQIQVIHQPNKGVAAARNAGLEAATGEYLLWVDPDDWVDPQWFARLSTIATRNRPDVVVFDSMRVEGDRTTKEEYGRPGGFVEKDVFCRDLARDIRMLSGLPNKMIRKALFQGIRFDPNLEVLEDYAVMMQLMQRAKSVYYTPQILYYYRQRETSLLHQYSPQKSLRCVHIALRRECEVEECYRKAAAVGTTVQAFLYCRAAAYDKRFDVESEDYRWCYRLLSSKLYLVCRDGDVPIKWKIKFILMRVGLLVPLLRMKNRLNNQEEAHKMEE